MTHEKNDTRRDAAFDVAIIFAGAAAALKYLHDLVRMFFFDRNFADFGFLYFLSDLLNKGINFARLDQDAIAKLAAASMIPVHIAGYKAGTMFYSPVFFSFLRLFAKLDFIFSLLLWTLLNNAALLASIYLIMRSSGMRFDVVRVSAVAIIVFLFQPLIETVGLGQFDCLVLFALTAALWATVSSREILAGFFLAIAVLMKPQYVLMWPLFLIKRLYKAFFSAVFFYLFFMVLSKPFSGFDPLKDYFGGLVNIVSFTVGEKILWGKNLSFVSALTRLLGSGHILAIALMCCLFAIVLIYLLLKTVWGKYNRGIFPLEFSCWLGVLFCLLPMLTENYLVLLYMPILVLFSRIGSEERPWQYIFIAGLVLLASRYSFERFPLFGSGIMSIFANGKLLGLILISMTALNCCRNRAERAG